MTEILNNAAWLAAIMRIGSAKNKPASLNAAAERAARLNALRAEYSTIFEKELRGELSNPNSNYRA